MTIKIKDVASLAGVSSATVSRALTNKTFVAEDTRRRVMQAVDLLGYHPSRVARSLRVRSSQIIGLIISDIQNPFFTSLVRAVEDQAYNNNYTVFLCNSDEDIKKESLYIDLMLTERVAGVIITPTKEKGSPIVNLVKANIPTVVVDRRVRDLDLDTVVVDNIAAANSLVQYLINQGHRRIGAILSLQQITTGRERLLGYEQALKNCGISINRRLVKTCLPKTSFGYQYTNELLDLKVPPTAIFAGNNLLAIGALKAIRDRNLSIPDQISLVSFDDMEWASLITPSLTTVSQPTYQMGQTAFELLLDRINNPSHPPIEKVLNTTLHLRDSVAQII